MNEISKRINVDDDVIEFTFKQCHTFREIKVNKIDIETQCEYTCTNKQWGFTIPSGVYREREENDASFGTLLNGTQRAPPWPQPQSVDDIMFLLPRQLNFGDRIEISGVMRNNPNVLSVSLLADSTYNVACEIEANFQTNNMAIRIVHDGNQEIINGNYQQDQATNYFTDSDFKFTFVLTVHENVQGHLLTIYIRDSFLEQIPLKHSIQDIRYIMLHGDIEKVENLDFKFG